MRIAVIDISTSGHRETYYKQFAETLCSMGHQLTLIAPDGNGIDEIISFLKLRTNSLRLLPAGKTLMKKWVVLYNALIRLKNLRIICKQLKETKAEIVFFPCLDDILPTLSPMWLFNKLLPYKWSGLLVQSVFPAYRPGLPDIRPFLKSNRCMGIGVLNECSVESLKPFQTRILLFPDFADLTTPDRPDPLMDIISKKANGRKIISLLGSIHPRKGIDLLLKVINFLPNDKYFFVIAGKPSLGDDCIKALNTFTDSRDNVYLGLEKIPSESAFNALVDGSDLIYAVYKHFTGSSNLLTKAAAFSKPIIVAKGFCMGLRVEEYGLGAVVDENNVQECADAIDKLCLDKPKTDGMEKYSTQHDVDKLVDCFNEILNQ